MDYVAVARDFGFPAAVTFFLLVRRDKVEKVVGLQQQILQLQLLICQKLGVDTALVTKLGDEK